LVRLHARHAGLADVSVSVLSKPPIFLLIIETPDRFELSYIILFEFLMEICVFFYLFTHQLLETVEIELPYEGTDVRMSEIFG